MRDATEAAGARARGDKGMCPADFRRLLRIPCANLCVEHWNERLEGS